VAKFSAKGKAWQAGPTRLVACFHPNISPLQNADISLFERTTLASARSNNEVRSSRPGSRIR
jgi:hypothetical protein